MVVGDPRQASTATPERSQQPTSGQSQSSQPLIPPYAQQRRRSVSATSSHSRTSSTLTASSRQALLERPTFDDPNRSSFQVHTEEARGSGQGHGRYHNIVNAQRGEPSDGFDRSGFPLTNEPPGLTNTPPSPRLLPTLRSSLSLNEGSVPGSPNRIKVRDLNHIQSFASEEVLTRSRHGSRHSLRGPGRGDNGQQYEISSMPVADIIEMVSGLLTKITTTNDRQHEHIHRHIPPPEGATGLSQQTTSVLAFHGKNVPSITILSYLSRIHKYCPTTYEVFLSLLVYFDRMAENINNGTLSSFRYADDGTETSRGPGSSAGLETPNARPADATASTRTEPLSEAEAYDLSHFFVVDSYNIHRLVIAGVTCASKFFSDVFYTNSRYAKVGGLPLIELNHLELQFLLLNDFRLSVPVEELEAYGSMLVEFYATEVMAQQQHGGRSTGDGLYMSTPTPRK